MAATLVLSLTQSGCIGAAGAKNTPINGPALSLATSTLSYGSVVDGAAGHLVLTMSNPGTAAVTITQFTFSSTAFNITGNYRVPMIIQPGQTGTLDIQFAPTTAGTINATLTMPNNASATPAVVKLTGTGVAAQAQIGVNPSSVPFGTVTVGSKAQQMMTLSNPGNIPLTVSQVSLSGAGYSIVGPFSLPMTVYPNQVAYFYVQFAPAASGAANGTITISSNASSATTTVPMTGNGTTSSNLPQISVSPNSVAFGSIADGSSATQKMTVSNPGSATLSITQISAAGTGFSVNGFTLPINVAAGQSASFNAQFAPAAAGSVNGSLSITSNAAPSTVTVPLSGTGTTTQSGITATPSSASFTNVVVGSPNSQTIKLQNAGSAGISITSAAVSGAGFSTTGLSTPLALAGGASTTFNVVFSPASAGNVTGSVVLTGSMSNSPMTIPLSGSAVATSAVLNPSTTSLTYTNVAVGSNSAQNVTLTNAGNSSVTISNVTESGAGFVASGVAAGQVVAAGNSATLTVTFTPASAATVTGSVVVTSTASNSPINIALTGTGVARVQHSVDLSWTASSSNTVVGYKVYRGSSSGGPYTLITNTPVTGTTFTDTTVAAGQTYFYVVTAVDGSGNESVNSNEVSAVVPTP